MITIKKAKTNAGGSLLWNSIPWRGRGGPSGILLVTKPRKASLRNFGQVTVWTQATVSPSSQNAFVPAKL